MNSETLENPKLQEVGGGDQQENKAEKGVASRKEPPAKLPASSTCGEPGEKRCSRSAHLILFLVLAIGGGTVAALLLTKGETSSLHPADARLSSPSQSPTPESAPPYEPPTPEDCDAIANGDAVNGQEDWIKQSFKVDLSVALIDSEVYDLFSLLHALETKIQNIFAPQISGCDITNTRRLLKLVRGTSRLLESSQYSVGNVEVLFYNYSFDDGVLLCNTDERKGTICYQVVFNLSLYIKGDETTSSLIDLITDVFGGTLIQKLGFDKSPIQSIQMQSVVRVEDHSSPEAPAVRPTLETRPTKPPGGRTAILQKILSKYKPFHSNALAWLTEIDTWIPPRNASDPQTLWVQRYILAAFYFSTNGDYWYINDGWMSAASVCRWYMKSDDSHCNHEDELTHIKLWRNRLRGSLPSEVGDLSTLVYFELGDNTFFNTSLPSELGKLSNLKVMKVSGDRHSGKVPSELGLMSQLTSLSLDDNDLSGTIPSSLGNLVNLRHLSLDSNRLTGSIPKEWIQMTSLESLILYSNRLTGSIPLLPSSSLSSCELQVPWGMNCFDEISNAVEGGMNCDVSICDSNG